ncbi:MAG: four helix bundle protein [Bacteroidota bacterium]
MTKEELQRRTKNLGVEVYKFCRKLERGYDSNVLGYQLLKSATSVGANYRAACRSRSANEFLAKLSICIEECDEVMFWLEFLNDVGDYKGIDSMKMEANELLSIFISSRKTVQKKLNHNS